MLIGFGVLFILLLIFYSIGVKVLEEEASNLDNSVVIKSKSITQEEGTIEVDDQSGLDGLFIKIAKNSYSSTTNFTIKTSEIKSHSFGEYFNPVTPLITIENNHEFSQIPMTVSIPISKQKDEFALAFYYDKNSNRLEAIPFTNLEDDNITIVTSHFSDIVVSVIKLVDLEALAFSTVDKIDTGFSPGVDDWQFTNYGSYIAPKGHCAGQAITMAWYYNEQYKDNGQPQLFNRFDNSTSSTKTPSFWHDDSQGYRFASVIQESISLDKVAEFIKLNDNILDEGPIFNAFAYSMLLTKEPQLMAIYKRENGKISEGHAITAYKVQSGRIYVADPNYPGQSDRYISTFNDTYTELIKSESSEELEVEIEGLYFEEYSSGSNASDIKEKGNTIYNSINYIGQSAIVDYNKIHQEYQKIFNQSVGNDLMPSLDIYYLSSIDSKDSSKRVYSPLTSSLKLETGYDKIFPEELKGKIEILISSKSKGLEIDVFNSLINPIQINEEPHKQKADGNIVFSIDLTEGSNDIGLLLNGVASGQTDSSYIDFKWININKSAAIDENEPEENLSDEESRSILSQGGGPKTYHLGPPTFIDTNSTNNDKISISVYQSDGPADSVPSHKITFEEEDELNRRIVIEIDCASAVTYMGYYGGSVNNLGFQSWKYENNKLIGYILLRDGKNVDVDIYMEKENLITIDFKGTD